MNYIEYLEKSIKSSYLEHTDCDIEIKKIVAFELIALQLCKLNEREDNKYSDKIEQVYVTGTTKKQIIKDIQNNLK